MLVLLKTPNSDVNNSHHQMSHAACNGYCRALKSACELYPSRHLALSLDPFSGMGFVLWCLAGYVFDKFICFFFLVNL